MALLKLLVGVKEGEGEDVTLPKLGVESQDRDGNGVAVVVEDAVGTTENELVPVKDGQPEEDKEGKGEEEGDRDILEVAVPEGVAMVKEAVGVTEGLEETCAECERLAEREVLTVGVEEREAASGVDDTVLVPAAGDAEPPKLELPQELAVGQGLGVLLGMGESVRRRDWVAW